MCRQARARRLHRADDYRLEEAIEALERTERGEGDTGAQAAHLSPLGLFLSPLGFFLRTPMPFIWRTRSFFPPT